MIELLEIFFAPLVLAILVEWLVLYFFGFRGKNYFFIIVAINLVTNPLMNFFILMVQSLNLFAFNVFSLLLLELAVVAVEWRMLIYLALGDAKKMLAVSLVMNLCSFASGLILSFFFSPPFMKPF
jgi:hypothetical protein